MTFDEVIGQQETKQRLLQMVQENRLPHAIMLCGPQGVGNKALAISLACQLLSSGNPSANTQAMLAKPPKPCKRQNSMPYSRVTDRLSAHCVANYNYLLVTFNLSKSVFL